MGLRRRLSNRPYKREAEFEVLRISWFISKKEK
jgi:hypothetical protein